jgi:hypothetical protein
LYDWRFTSWLQANAYLQQLKLEENTVSSLLEIIATYELNYVIVFLSIANDKKILDFVAKVGNLSHSVLLTYMQALGRILTLPEILKFIQFSQCRNHHQFLFPK